MVDIIHKQMAVKVCLHLAKCGTMIQSILYKLNHSEKVNLKSSADLIVFGQTVLKMSARQKYRRHRNRITVLKAAKSGGGNP